MIGTYYPPGGFFDADFPEPLYFCAPIIPAGGVALLHGPPGVGKTQVALTLAVAALKGEAFLNEYTCHKSSVLLIEADMPRKLLQERLHLAPDTRNVEVLYCDPYNIVKIHKEWANDQSELPAPMADAVERYPGLVIVDTLRLCHNEDEMKEEAAKLVYSAFKAIFRGSTFLFLHHDRKKPTSSFSSPHFEEAAAGNQAWKGNADTLIRLDKEHNTKGGDHVATLTFSKHRSMSEPAPIVVKMHPETMLVEPTAPSTRQHLMKWLDEHPQGTQEEVRNWMITTNICSRATAYRMVKDYASHRRLKA